MMKAAILIALALPVSAVEASTEKKANQTYTISAAALKAKVQSEAQKLENARIKSSQSMDKMMEHARTMTQSARLQDMAGLIEGKDKGAEMIKSLSAEAKDALAGLQKMWMDTTTTTLEKVTTIQASLPKGVEAMDPEKENAHKGAFMQVEEVVEPFMTNVEAMQSKFPELSPWTEKVHSYSAFFQKDNLEEMFGSNLPAFRKYKKEFSGYKKEHQEQILNFMEMFEMNDILTVLQSPEF
eukprot:gnl/MRDRNA2_/MRDRNA2_67756_c0_seq1.p1 gnl/MRDRNA2_/MRDRNA2_67756_c0~~gnl/MRDRNA2_/MRDRNA2_67756_c0_seq1.p1  ORF type:complete len:240 (+),score=81.61 gnl/MRDRNA2_/MRDRNA2_67756_c0_seq1:79-798(+)